MTRRGRPSPDRTKAGPDLEWLARLYEQLARDQGAGIASTLDAEQRVQLLQFLHGALIGDDLRQRVHAPIEGAPSDGAHLWIAIDVLLLDERAGKVARGAVADAWKLRDETVRGIVRTHRPSALELIAATRSRSALAQVVAFHRKRLVGN